MLGAGLPFFRRFAAELEKKFLWMLFLSTERRRRISFEEFFRGGFKSVFFPVKRARGSGTVHQQGSPESVISSSGAASSSRGEGCGILPAGTSSTPLSVTSKTGVKGSISRCSVKQAKPFDESNANASQTFVSAFPLSRRETIWSLEKIGKPFAVASAQCSTPCR